jgi:hypothetical protein
LSDGELNVLIENLPHQFRPDESEFGQSAD